PLGTVKQGANSEGDAKNYAELTLNYKENNQLAFHSNLKKQQTINSVEMYRKLLKNQKDHSVIIISVGFSTNLARLLASEADQLSSLSGLQLVAKKVKSEEHTFELQSRENLVCRLLLEKKKKKNTQ